MRAADNEIDTKKTSEQVFLMLQGPATPFFNELASALKSNGYKVYRILFCKGDEVFWTQDSIKFKGPVDVFIPFLQNIIEQYHITDLILFGDCRPRHREAIQLAKLHKLEVYVFEEGYIRPNWITLEKNGVNANSCFNKTKLSLKKQDHEILESIKEQEVGTALAIRGLHDLRYQLANAMNAYFYPLYQTHKSKKSKLEYLGFCRRSLTLPKAYFNANRIIEQFVSEKTIFYFLPLQINSDAQIRIHSSFSSVAEAIELVVRSFAAFAPTNAKLLLKRHPFDDGLFNYKTFLKKLINKFTLHNRVHLIDGGSLSTILKHAKGTVTINSTVGTLALKHECPTIVLGKAIYDIPGLTYQGELNEFWHNPEKPDPFLFNKFYSEIIQHSQINGGFYSKKGIKMAVENSIKKLTWGNRSARQNHSEPLYRG